METIQAIPEWKAAVDENSVILRETTRRQERIERQKKRANKWLDDLLRKRFGEMDDYMIIPNLMTEFEKMGFIFTQAAEEVTITDPKHDLSFWVDAVLENNDIKMAIDIKSKPTVDDINDHVERMEKLRRHADMHSNQRFADKRKYLGAIAGVVFGDSAKTYALKKGFYVVEPSGDTFNITEPEGAYYPHEW
ncbi:hypothetical protein FACS189461_1140 [Spirochaetia bacterium]|nr:hypothetical protein FACS189461_1140 [Spirochaetia bacterium]